MLVARRRGTEERVEALASEQQRAVFRQALKSARSEQGISQRELAGKLGVSPGTVAQWETGETAPRLQTAVRLEGVLSLAEGTLLRLLGYLHPDAQARTVAGVIEAVQADPNLDDDDRELLASIYAQLVRRRHAKQPPQ